MPGATLEDLAAVHGAGFVGHDVRRPGHFPFLVKLLDPAGWLSVQVHPDDEQARRLEGPEYVGKTEGWYVVDASPCAAILLGVRPSVTPEAVRDGIRRGDVSGLLVRRRVSAGEAYLVPAGTLHAVGPGALLYEIQQPSDITYRCDDWGRPATAGRPLHLDQSLAVARTAPWTRCLPSASPTDREAVLISCEHFVLERLRPTPGDPVSREPAMSSVHALTVVGGSAVVRGEGWTERLAIHETLVIPANAGPWKVAPAEAASRAVASPATEVLLARVAHQLDDGHVGC